ncbi:MAG: hypothetical protein US76_02825 [Parcubacteria group bacterium GW2011_GWA2_38_13b]|nr:MAG: hypothetical protein US76_02825 [Parcubacteria group bacterium GW2011_GWA2_38_13b]
MCKPVIYLYPERETKLNVQVDPIGGFTKTIPEYPPGGWDVTAHPDGKIIDNATGITYDYLYWSGISLGQFKNDEGWVVGQHDLGSFFDEKLKRLGMNEKEINDFKEYWLGRLIDKPFYQIFFLPKNIVDALAPLKITSVKEDAVLRIIMAVKGLDQFQEMPEQRLPQIPKRKGFTVVEWGGIIVK